MPLTLNVGISKKIGLSEYGSLGAKCNVAVEPDGSLPQNDLNGFHRRVRDTVASWRARRLAPL